MGPAGTGGICPGDGFAADHGISEGIRVRHDRNWDSSRPLLISSLKRAYTV